MMIARQVPGRQRWRGLAIWLKQARRFAGERCMRRHAIRTMAIAAAMAFTLGAACAQDDEKECDDIMDELKKLGERLMNTTEPKGIGPVCAATGQLLGIMKASREVAAECYDEGRKRDQLLLTFDKATKDRKAKIVSVCKGRARRPLQACCSHARARAHRRPAGTI